MDKKIILVSCSPRRRELMEQMELDFTVCSKSSFIEEIPDGIDPEKVPAFFAEGKSFGYEGRLDNGTVLVSADTVVICDGEIFGKPGSKDQARLMLHKLSGKTHKVVSSVCVRDSIRYKTLSDTALVSFRNLTEREIGHYVEKFNPIDKAGGYGIQEWIGLIGIEKIEGSFYTIMGLPTHLLYSLLEEF